MQTLSFFSVTNTPAILKILFIYYSANTDFLYSHLPNG